MENRKISLWRSIGAGLLGTWIAGRVTRSRSLPDAPRLAGRRLGERILGRSLSPRERRFAELAFLGIYSTNWGLIYSFVRSRVPAARRARGVPFGVAFFGACDGVLGPSLKVAPTIRRISLKDNLQEFAAHIAWTLGAETFHRATRPRFLPT